MGWLIDLCLWVYSMYWHFHTEKQKLLDEDSDVYTFLLHSGRLMTAIFFLAYYLVSGNYFHRIQISIALC